MLERTRVSSVIRSHPQSVVALFALALTGCAIERPFEGPGIEDGALKEPREGTYIVSTTRIALADTNEAGDAFATHMENLQKALPDHEGVVGWSFSFVPFTNDEYRTLAIWESEEAMLAWVLSDVHTTAMADFAEHGYAEAGETTAWEATADELPPTWAEARERLDEQGRSAY
jgi:heme-degrading monooxygenase HmoA